MWHIYVPLILPYFSLKNASFLVFSQINKLFQKLITKEVCKFHFTVCVGGCPILKPFLFDCREITLKGNRLRPCYNLYCTAKWKSLVLQDVTVTGLEVLSDLTSLQYYCKLNPPIPLLLCPFVTILQTNAFIYESQWLAFPKLQSLKYEGHSLFYNHTFPHLESLDCLSICCSDVLLSPVLTRLSVTIRNIEECKLLFTCPLLTDLSVLFIGDDVSYLITAVNNLGNLRRLKLKCYPCISRSSFVCPVLEYYDN